MGAINVSNEYRNKATKVVLYYVIIIIIIDFT